MSKKLKIDVFAKLAEHEKKEGRGISLSKLADEVGITRQTLGNWDSGESLKTLNDIKKLADYFGCSLESLIKQV